MPDQKAPGFVIVCQRYDSTPIFVCRAGKNFGWTTQKIAAKPFKRKEAATIAQGLLDLSHGAYSYRVEPQA